MNTIGNSRPPEVVMITGASAGLGRAITREFARRGARLGLIARDEDRLESAVREAQKLGGQAIALPADVADAEEVQKAGDRLEQEFGPFDIWINNAMATVFGRFDSITPQEYARVTEVTYLGTVWGTMVALKSMKARNHGTIVQVGSALAYRSIPLQAPYCGAKHAIMGFTDTIRTELIHDRSAVHLTMVQMPALNTPQFDWCRNHMSHHPQPVPPIYQPEIGARAVYWAAHHRKRELYVGLSSIEAILGNKVASRTLDRYLGRHDFSAQQTEKPADPASRGNLTEPVPGDFRARGSFDERSTDGAPSLWLSTHRKLALAGLTTLALGGMLVSLAFANRQ